MINVTKQENTLIFTFGGKSFTQNDLLKNRVELFKELTGVTNVTEDVFETRDIRLSYKEIPAYFLLIVLNSKSNDNDLRIWKETIQKIINWVEDKKHQEAGRAPFRMSMINGETFYSIDNGYYQISREEFLLNAKKYFKRLTGIAECDLFPFSGDDIDVKYGIFKTSFQSCPLPDANSSDVKIQDWKTFMRKVKNWVDSKKPLNVNEEKDLAF